MVTAETEEQMWIRRRKMLATVQVAGGALEQALDTAEVVETPPGDVL